MLSRRIQAKEETSALQRGHSHTMPLISTSLRFVFAQNCQRAQSLVCHLTTVKPVLRGHRIKRTPSIKRTVAEVPKFISLIYFK